MKYNREQISKIFDNYAKEKKVPFIIEVLGTPNSGKTTAIQTFEKILKRNNIKYKIIYEVAGRCKIKNKLSPDFNLWTMTETMKQLLEIFNSNYDIVICERGLLDTICWCDLFLKENKILKDEYENIVNFVLLNRFTKNICYSYIIKCSVDASMKRENLDDLLDIKGSIVNETILKKYNDSLECVSKKYVSNFQKIEEMDTSNMTQIEINKSFVNSIFNYLNNTDKK